LNLWSSRVSNMLPFTLFSLRAKSYLCV